MCQVNNEALFASPEAGWVSSNMAKASVLIILWWDVWKVVGEHIYQPGKWDLSDAAKDQPLLQ